MRKLEPVYETSHERRQVAWWMLEAITGMSRATLLADSPDLTHEQERLLDEWVHQQVMHYKPLQYLIGFVPFLDVIINVEPPVAIPRLETEFWVEKLIEDLEIVKEHPLAILDLCTGSGCVALALAHRLPAAQVVGVDISEKALEIARHNKRNNGISNVEFIYSDLFERLYEMRFDVIVGNPPYISTDEWQVLDPRVTQWEDERALRADEDGLAVIRAIIDQAPQFFLLPSIVQDYKLPQLVLEIGAQQGPSVHDLLAERGYHAIVIEHDQYARDRIACASYYKK